MRRIVLMITVAVLLGLSLRATPRAQAPTPAPAAAAQGSTAPKFNEDDTLMLQALASVLQFANTECQGLESVKRYNAQRQQILTRIETKYPGYTIDWNVGAMVAKPPATK